ncbi:hypothetical protein SpCBS45565_g05722 [Spizellomyces sp. 'palustris']|nr:hypothetical protein SpCBS45565_g05722 [Spizellomyces sp. 'palustris']
MASSDIVPTIPIRVILRVRPIESEIALSVDPPSSLTLRTPALRTFSYDAVYDSPVGQEDVWDGVRGAVEGVLDGINGTVLAYGQTSSGKTFTMGSDHIGSVGNERKGIIPRAVEWIFDRVEERKRMDAMVNYVVRVSFLEIYQEQIRDLLMPSSDPKDLSIRKDKHGVTIVSGLSQVTVSTAEEALGLLESGAIERTTGDTQMHLKSSRSHAIFMLMVEQLAPDGAALRVSKLCLVDLAGSERLKRTGAAGIRFKESVKINTGLLALGNVISRLGDGSPIKDRHVPYRESKLTRLLQDSLGGNAKTVMIACVSPAVEDVDETLNTLKYAHRARKIQNKPIINVIDHQAVKMVSMQEKIDLLEGRLKGFKEAKAEDVLVDDDEDDTDGEWMKGFVEELRVRTSKANRALKELEIVTQERDALAERITELEDHFRDEYSELQASHQEELDDLIQEREVLNQRVAELETETQNLRTEKNEVVRDAGLLVDVVVGILSGQNVQVGDGVKGVVKRWRPDSGICLERFGQPNDAESAQITGTDVTWHDSLMPLSQSNPETPDITISRPSSAGSGSGRGYQRRRIRKVSMPDPTNAALIDRQHAAIRRLEDELFDSEAEVKRLGGCLDEMREEKGRIIDRMERVNSEVIMENDALHAEVERLRKSLHHDSISDEDHPPDEAKITDIRGEADRSPDKAVNDENAQKASRRWPLDPEKLVDEIWVENERLSRELDMDDQTESDAFMNEGSDADEDDRTEIGDEEDVHQSKNSPLYDAENEGSDMFPVHTSENHSFPPVPDAQIADVAPAPQAQTQLLRELEVANKARVEVARDLTKAHKETERLRHHHAERIQKLERELDHARSEITKTRYEVGEKEAAKEKLKDDYERKIKQLETQVSKLKAKQKDWEKLCKEKEFADRKAQDLREEVTKLGHQSAALKKKIKEESEKATELDSRRAKEIASLKKQHEEDNRKIRQLDQQNEVLRKKLDRKTEEMSALKGRKDGRAKSAGAELPERRPKPADIRHEKAEETGLSQDAVEPLEVNAEHIVEIERSLQARAKEMENFKQYHAISTQLRELRLAVDGLDRELEEGELILEDLSPEVQDEMRQAVHERVEEIRQERDELAGQLEDLKREKKSAEALLNVVDSKDEQVPDDIDYKALVREFGNRAEIVELCEDLKSATLPEARSLVINCLRELLRLQNLVDEGNSEMGNGRIEGQRNRPVQDIETQTDSSTNAQDAEKLAHDLANYRKTNKDLRNKLKEVVAVNHKLAAALEKERRDRRQG